MADVSLTLVGLRRVGLSLGLALRRYQESPRAAHRFTITGTDQDASVGKEAQKRGMIDAYERNLSAACAEADIVFIDAPLMALREHLKALGPVVKSGCVILETSILKQPPIEWASSYLPESAYLVGLAPVLNPDILHDTSLDELESARADLFTNGNLYIAPSATCAAEAVQLASDLVGLLGLEPHFLEPAEHDGFAAAVELLPALLSLALVGTASSAPSWKDMRRLTNPTFALSTMALTKNPEDLVESLRLDRESVLHYLDSALEQLHALRRLLAEEDPAALREALANISTEYVKWLSQRESGRWRDRPSVETPPIRANLLQGLFGSFLVRGKKDDEKD